MSPSPGGGRPARPSRSGERRIERARERLHIARGGGCVPFGEVSCLDSGIEHNCCASLLLDGFSVEEITAVGG